MKTTLQITLEPDDYEALELTSAAEDQVVVDAVARNLGLSSLSGGWTWKVTRPKDEPTIKKLVATHVPNGSNILL